MNKTTFEAFILDVPEQKEKFDKEYEEFLLFESELEEKEKGYFSVIKEKMRSNKAQIRH